MDNCFIAIIFIYINKFFFFEMEFKAAYHIDCGESPGFGVKSPAEEYREETITVDGPEHAYDEAMNRAKILAGDYLSNPDTGYTTVHLLSLKGPEGFVAFDTSKVIVRRSMLEHLLDTLSETQAH